MQRCLVEVLDGERMVGVGTFHQLLEVVIAALLKWLFWPVGHRNYSWVSHSMPLLLVLLPLSEGRARVLVLTLGFALLLAITKDRVDHLLTEGMVSGNIQQVAGRPGLDAAKLVNQGLAGCPSKESADDFHVDDVMKGVALPREPANIVSQGLVRLLLAAFEIPGVPRMHVGPLEVPYKDLFEACPVADAIGRKEFE